MRLFRKTDPLDLPMAMSGVKLADRVLIIGCSDPGLIARLAIKVGLTGRACAVDAVQDRVAGAARIAEREGALVEMAEAPGWRVPYDEEAFDLVVIRSVHAGDPPDGAGGEAHRVLRAGGRCLVITGARRGFGAWRARAGAAAAAPREDVLRTAGFAAVRTLAAREGLVFVEGIKRTPRA